jgi:hypothetical protein
MQYWMGPNAKLLLSNLYTARYRTNTMADNASITAASESHLHAARAKQARGICPMIDGSFAVWLRNMQLHAEGSP